MQRAGIALVVVAASAASSLADPPRPERDPAVAKLREVLPRGWSLAVQGNVLAIKRDARVLLAGRHIENAAHQANIYVAPPLDAPGVDLVLRYRIEPKWSERQVADARAANAKLYAELASSRARYRIDDIPTSKGRPLPATPDEEQRLAAFERVQAQTIARLVALPRCTLGGFSLFDSPATYDQLSLIVDPTSAMREAYAIIELVKRRCR